MDKSTLAAAKSYARELLENAAELGVDLSKYLKVQDFNKYLELGLVNYATKKEVNLKVDKDGNKVLTDVNFSTEYENKLNSLKNFSKDYNELINKPIIPNINGLASEDYVNNKLATLPEKDLSEYEKTKDVNSKLLNKADKVHTHEMNEIKDLSAKFNEYYKKAETLSSVEIRELIADLLKGMNWKESVETYEDLPKENNLESDVRIVKNNKCLYMWIDSRWSELFSMEVIALATNVLDGLMSKEDKQKLDSIIVDNLVDKNFLQTELNKKSDKAHTHDIYVTKESGKSLVDDIKISKIDSLMSMSIPTKTSELLNDSRFITSDYLSNYVSTSQIDDKLTNYAKLENIANKLEESNIVAGKNVTITKTDNNIIIEAYVKNNGLGTYIDDETISEESTYSSKKINDEIVLAKTSISYLNIKNKPTINNVELIGNKTLADIGIIVDNDPTENSNNLVKSGGVKAQINKLNTNKVDKVAGKGLSSNDFTNDYKSKLEGLAGGNITEENAAKLNDLLNILNKKNPQQYLGTNLNNELGLYYFPINQNTHNSIEQRVSLDVTTGSTITIESSIDTSTQKAFVQVYKYIEGLQNVLNTIKEFNNSNSENFINSNNISFDTNCHIKNNFYYNTIVVDNLYETDIINVEDFLNINDIKEAKN